MKKTKQKMLDEFDKFMLDEEFSFYTIAFMVKLLGEEYYKDLIKDSPIAQAVFNKYKKLPVKRRLKYETNIYDKYIKEIMKRKKTFTGDN
ncbi:MAG: hypothetical protein N2999_01415 [Proteobacteria bacterium]|nr:hypothetical protein [Pseudomonadota bacterium]